MNVHWSVLLLVDLKTVVGMKFSSSAQIARFIDNAHLLNQSLKGIFMHSPPHAAEYQYFFCTQHKYPAQRIAS